jgi:hypothetical protein
MKLEKILKIPKGTRHRLKSRETLLSIKFDTLKVLEETSINTTIDDLLSLDMTRRTVFRQVFKESYYLIKDRYTFQYKKDKQGASVWGFQQRNRVGIWYTNKFWKSLDHETWESGFNYMGNQRMDFLR